MMLVEYNNIDDYRVIDNTVVFIDRINQRIKILTDKHISKHTLDQVKQLAEDTGMGKIVACAPDSHQQIFEGQGFAVEGKLQGFFTGKDAQYYSFFVSPSRGKSLNEYDGVLPAGNNWEKVKPADSQTDFSYEIRTAIETDIGEMTSLFRLVFETYPSPVFDERFLYSNMKNNRALYKVAVHGNRIIGIASAEKDPSNLNAEITDCVTNPKYRRQGILTSLITTLEDYLEAEGYICLYTICRATETAVNKVFCRKGYTFSGRLIKNCHICGSFEDMNLLVKLLA